MYHLQNELSVARGLRQKRDYFFSKNGNEMTNVHFTTQNTTDVHDMYNLQRNIVFLTSS